MKYQIIEYLGRSWEKCDGDSLGSKDSRFKNYYNNLKEAEEDFNCAIKILKREYLKEIESSCLNHLDQNSEFRAIELISINDNDDEEIETIRFEILANKEI